MLKRIKRHISLFATCSVAAICMGAVVASCSNDAIVSTADNGSDSEAAAYYLAIKIFDTSDGTAMETRAAFDSDDDDFNDDSNVFNKGLKEEKAIYDNYANGMPNFIMLFDKAGRKIGDLLHIKPLLPEETKDPEKEKDNTSYSLFVATLSEDDVLYKIKKGEGSFSEVKVLLVLNASPAIRTKLKGSDSYKEICELTMNEPATKEEANAGVEGSTGGDTGGGKPATQSDPTKFLYLDVTDDSDAKQPKYFTMSSSMVIKGNDVVAATEKETLKDHLQPTKELARQNPFKMYVERAQSKYTVLFKKGGKQYYFDSASTESSDDLEYIPETSSLVYDSETDFTPTDPNIQSGLRYVKEYTRGTSVNSRGDVTVNEGSWKVNITGWGVNGLEKNEYLFKQIKPNTNYFSGWESPKYTYRNFWAESCHYSGGIYPDQYREVLGWNEKNELVKDDDVKTGTENATLNYFSFNALEQKDPHQYSPENTFNASVFGDNLTEAFDSKAFLRVGTHLIVTAELLIEGIDYGTEANTTTVADKLYMNGIYWTEAAYKEYVAEYLAYWMLTETNQDKFGPNDGIFYVLDNGTYRPAKGDDFKLEAAYIKGGDGWVYLSPNDVVTLYTRTTDENGEGKYIPIDPGKYKTLAYEHQDLMAGHFTGGRMYYAVPVEHNNVGVKKTTIATGDYGAVRNHWYSFTVNNIFSVGTPVDKPNEPIIPNPEPKNPGLGVEINIINWHRISTGVDISSQRPGK